MGVPNPGCTDCELGCSMYCKYLCSSICQSEVTAGIGGCTDCTGSCSSSCTGSCTNGCGNSCGAQNQEEVIANFGNGIGVGKIIYYNELNNIYAKVYCERRRRGEGKNNIGWDNITQNKPVYKSIIKGIYDNYNAWHSPQKDIPIQADNIIRASDLAEITEQTKRDMNEIMTWDNWES